MFVYCTATAVYLLPVGLIVVGCLVNVIAAFATAAFTVYTHTTPRSHALPVITVRLRVTTTVYPTADVGCVVRAPCYVYCAV